MLKEDKGMDEDSSINPTYGSRSIGAYVLEKYNKVDNIDIQSVVLVPLGNESIASANTVFPFTLFPDTIILDRKKVTIIRRSFFMVSDTISVRIEDILHVALSLGPFFGSITLETRFFNHEKSYSLKWLTRKDAIYLKHMIHGYVIALHSGVAVDSKEKEPLIELLEELGHDTNV